MTIAQIAFINNAERSNQYGGKRFLGFTAKGAEVWISLHTERNSLKASVSTTHNLDSLRDSNAVLASKRVTLRRGTTNRYSAEELIRQRKRDMGGAVTLSTLDYLEKLMGAVERGYGKPFVNGQITSVMFSYLAQAIFEGSYDYQKGDNTWSYILKKWNFPRGEYFTVLGLP